MRYKNIEQREIISKPYIDLGGMILIASRPGLGKSKTCCEIYKQYIQKFYCLYFDLDSSHSHRFMDYKSDKVIDEFMTSAEIIKKIQYEAKHHNLKIVFIDEIRSLSDKTDWFYSTLSSLAWQYKIVFIFTYNLPRRVERRVHHLPNKRDLNEVDFIGRFAQKHIVIARPSIYSRKHIEDKLIYYVYKDWRSN